jgi:4-hydroxysphinganine ceramide fatty acyl 2-hydroxylase
LAGLSPGKRGILIAPVAPWLWPSGHSRFRLESVKPRDSVSAARRGGELADTPDRRGCRNMFLVFVGHGGVAALLLGVAVETLLWLSGAVALQPGMILLGALLFYLVEYGMHRFAFHSPPLPWPQLRKLQHRLHYDHHVEPGRLDLLFLPIWFLVPNIGLAVGLFALIFGGPSAPSALFGMMLAILHYEWVHYVAHIPYVPRTKLGRFIKQYHLRHHFISEKHWFGVSNPALDGVFGTFRGPDASEKSATTRKLYS